MIPDYVTALVQEIRLRSPSTVLQPKDNAATVYFGGGTPSLLGPQHLGAILRALDNAFGLCRQAEITLEANPGTQVRLACENYGVTPKNVDQILDRLMMRFV